MRANLVAIGVAAVGLAGLDWFARPGEPPPAPRGIVVVRGGAPTAAAPVRADPQSPAMTADQPLEVAAAEDLGVWATPAEWGPSGSD